MLTEKIEPFGNAFFNNRPMEEEEEEMEEEEEEKGGWRSITNRIYGDTVSGHYGLKGTTPKSNKKTSSTK